MIWPEPVLLIALIQALAVLTRPVPIARPRPACIRWKLVADVAIGSRGMASMVAPGHR